MTVRGYVDRPALSARSRDLLSSRLRELEARIPALQRELAGWPDDPHTAAALAMARDEASRLRSTLLQAVAIEDLPDDPNVVEVGDALILRNLSNEDLEEYIVVHEPEARLDDTWISAGSPLGAAAVGHRPGEIVEVPTPLGTVRYEILYVRRAQGLDAAT